MDHDSRFAKYADRRRHWDELMDGVEEWSRTVTTEKCLAELCEYGVPCSAYRTVAEAMADPQIAHRGALAEVEDDAGTFQVMNLPFRMSGGQASRRKAHRRSRRTYRALLGESGLSEAEIAAVAGKVAAGA